MDVDVITTVEIRRPREVVAAFASDPVNAPAWYRRIVAVSWESQPPLRLGSRLRFVARFMGRRLEYTYEVTDLDPGTRLVMATSQGPFPMETTYEWSAVDDHTTRMTLRNRGTPSGFSRMTAAVVGPMIRRANRQDLADLKRLLEGGG
jgi:hypothetical protein